MSRKRRQPKTSDSSEPSRQAVAAEPESGSGGETLLLEESPPTSAQWTILRERILTDQRDQPIVEVFQDAVWRGTIYRWGVATAFGKPCDLQIEWLTRTAVGANTAGKRFCGIEPDAMAWRFQESLVQNPNNLSDVWSVLSWAAAMPGLLHHLEEADWWSLLGTIQDFRDGLLQRDPTHPAVLIGVAEIGLTLAHRLRALPSCRRLADSSIEALKRWCEQDDLSVSAVLSQPHQCRLALASLLRQRRLLRFVGPAKPSNKKKQRKNGKSKSDVVGPAFEKSIDEIGIELATWVAALTGRGGVQAFSTLTTREVQDDVGKHGLLTYAADLDEESLRPAMKAALGTSQSKGRLAWQVSLPESMLHDEDARVACLLPEWDVRRGRMVVDYADRQTRLELAAGKSILISGTCESVVVVDGQPLEPEGDWEATCEYTDDDVHYLELEQLHQGGYVLQRQIMVVREDRCCFFADAVVRGRVPSGSARSADNPGDGDGNGTGRREQHKDPADALPLIEYQVRLPLADKIDVQGEQETTELFLGDHRRRALVMPLSAGEWKNASSTTRLQATEDRHLLLAARGRGQLFVPLWMDLSRDRFASKRTWRQLTVGEQLKLIPPRTAAAFRIQLGKTQWIVYRSMAVSGPRTFMGKQIIADFYCARFDAEEESYEDLITVEDNPS
ncbi:hypothetical protein Mal15_08690 [Stieleria maiorica]|uniref:Uncharacterized protein n=1 Tax=Stieleria maiorica TaxID=2795974 RepID=A0A5B9M7Z5_9BACT|nr:hypothetical protein [Stieleria maiorica]QEF96839.1 hypothetical protein Mal15_08690 [Stieleria maiorica]